MDVSYNKLFKLLIDKGMKKTVFAKTVGISANTLAKLSHNEMVSMEIIVRICRTLHCTVDDIRNDRKRGGRIYVSEINDASQFQMFFGFESEL